VGALPARHICLHNARSVNRLDPVPLLADRRPAELLVHDEAEPCPYLPGRVARMPLRLPVRALTHDELDARLAGGDRRHGALFYRPSCDGCDACQAIRIDVTDWRFSRSQRRTLRQGDAALRVSIGPPVVDGERVALYDKHRFGRGLAKADTRPMDSQSYQRFLVDRFCDAFEVRYRMDGELVGVAVTDRGEDSLSAVYCFYDPDVSAVGIGTYSILKQVQIAQERRHRYLYLGLYIEDCPPMAYKARFLPHERRIHGRWRRFDKSNASAVRQP